MILVSCCNENGGLYVVDPESGKVETVLDLEVRGVVKLNGYWFAASGPGTSKSRKIHKLDAGFNIVATYGDERDWHGLEVRDGNLLAVDAVKDEIVELDSDLGLVRTITWHDTDEKRHTNDICPIESGLLLSSFGQGISLMPVSGPAVRKYRTGDQPHSVTVGGGRVWWCDSKAGLVLRDREIMRNSDRYLRGLRVVAGGFWYGESNRRGHSSGNCAMLRHSDGLTIEMPSPEIYTMRIMQ